MIRLLFDQNISYRVVKQLKLSLPNVIGVRDVGLYEADDFAIWDYVRRENYVVVTFDKDIPMIGSVRGFPPKSSGCVPVTWVIRLQLICSLTEWMNWSTSTVNKILAVY